MLFGIDNNTWALMFLGLVNLYAAILAKRTFEQAKKTELNTNSMREQLVVKTEIAARLAGREEMHEQVATAEAATLAATTAGDARVAEANRTHEVQTAAVEKGTKDAIEPIAKEAVIEGTEKAIAEMKDKGE